MYNQGIFIKGYCKGCAVAAKSLQSCLTLCDPIDGRPPGSPVPGILQARTLEWVAISFSNAWKWKVKVKLLSRVRLLATPWTAAHQTPLSMGFSRQEYWSGVPLPSLCKGCILGLKKKRATNELIYETEIRLQMKKTNVWLPRGKRGGVNRKIDIDIYTLLYTQVTNKNLL